jgi:hypothetical protein
LPGTLAENWLGFYPQPFFQGNSFLVISKELIIGLGLGYEIFKCPAEFLPGIVFLNSFLG